MNFSSVTIDQLNAASTPNLNAANFGVVKMSHDGKVTDYNDNQEKHTGMSKSAVMGKHFFTQVAPCTNNFMVAQKFENENSLAFSCSTPGRNQDEITLYEISDKQFYKTLAVSHDQSEEQAGA